MTYPKQVHILPGDTVIVNYVIKATDSLAFQGYTTFFDASGNSNISVSMFSWSDTTPDPVTGNPGTFIQGKSKSGGWYNDGFYHEVTDYCVR